MITVGMQVLTANTSLKVAPFGRWAPQTYMGNGCANN